MMKKMTGLVLTMTFASFLSACALNSSTDEKANKETTSAVQTADIKQIKDQVIKASNTGNIPAKALERKDTFIAGMSAPGGVFLPYFYDNGWDGNATSPIFSPLVDLDKNGKPIPILSKSWEISDDQLVYTFHLKDDLKFSNGSPLTADDVAFTLTLLHDPAYDGWGDLAAATIKGGKDYKDGKAKTIEGIKVVDPLTIKITTEKVNAKALLLLGGIVLSKDYYGKDYTYAHLDYLKKLYSKPVGSGPYKLEKYIPGQEIRYVANKNYYDGPPKVKNFIYKVTTPETTSQLFEAGETDYDRFPAEPESVEQLKELGFANIKVTTANSYSYAYINNTKPYLKDKAVRQALIYGLDRQKITDVTYKGYGTVANVPVSPVSWAYTEDGINKYKYDVKKAKQLLDEAGWKVGKDGIRAKGETKLKISYLTSRNDDDFIPIAKENYKALGIQFNPEVLDFNTLLTKLNKKDYDLAAVSTPMLSDPDDAVADLASTHPDNSAGYSNPKVDKLLEESVSTTDINERKKIYHELYKELSDDPPVILLNYRKVIHANNARISGLNPDNFTGISSSLPNLSIKE
ncbi:ABC transporter substrate-binding protein [Priestia megaterium]|uniref:ABC transporter substrate-binding protein n=1 Tax=Priestia megaterium TaxID=1404 RepID=UPI000BEB6056|nr:ABC transporter substrate-binding protein [Priestia megaterium]MED4065437.1 ABC transporter substrate-binding protein [Priestia megaterium]PED68173.1 ABC transporter substrate-binding protein [Priestia megaterium]PFK55464.1 ABC transporter substrate-binding protein [Priestia megaterium]PGN10150.1 ABC transporter substrate-binding protein [Priestia megaterium]